MDRIWPPGCPNKTVSHSSRNRIPVARGDVDDNQGARIIYLFAIFIHVDARSGLPRGSPQKEMHPDDIDSFPFYRPEPSLIFRKLPELQPAVMYLFGRDSDLSKSDACQEKLRLTGTGVGGSGGVSCGRVKDRRSESRKIYRINRVFLNVLAS